MAQGCQELCLEGLGGTLLPFQVRYMEVRLGGARWRPFAKALLDMAGGEPEFASSMLLRSHGSLHAAVGGGAMSSVA